MAAPYQLVRAVDIEQALIDWAPGAMAGLGWTVAVADILTSAESIAVYRTGGVMRDIVTDSPTIGVDVTAKTKTRASNMAADFRALIHGLEQRELGTIAVQRVQEFGGPSHDPIDDRPNRYSMILSLDVSAAIIG